MASEFYESRGTSGQQQGLHSLSVAGVASGKYFIPVFVLLRLFFFPLRLMSVFSPSLMQMPSRMKAIAEKVANPDMIKQQFLISTLPYRAPPRIGPITKADEMLIKTTNPHSIQRRAGCCFKSVLNFVCFNFNSTLS